MFFTRSLANKEQGTGPGPEIALLEQESGVSL